MERRDYITAVFNFLFTVKSLVSFAKAASQSMNHAMQNKKVENEHQSRDSVIFEGLKICRSC
jgi:hypothetical protein